MRLAPMPAAMRAFGPPPSLQEIEVIARATLEGLPEPFASKLRGVVLQVQDFANDEILASMGMEDPFELTGLYEGIPLSEKSVDQSGALPDRILLFRIPILDEWANGEDSLEQLVRHVVIHEAGHHFGFSDDDMHLLEDAE
jgi:predicted Zn-dependent protease with MMP-like domain